LAQENVRNTNEDASELACSVVSRNDSTKSSPVNSAVTAIEIPNIQVEFIVSSSLSFGYVIKVSLFCNLIVTYSWFQTLYGHFMACFGQDAWQQGLALIVEYDSVYRLTP